jgi:hypothetical protein
MMVAASLLGLLAVVILSGSAPTAAIAATETDCATIDDRRARLRCTDEFTAAIGSRAKVAVRQTLKRPDTAVFSAFRLVPGSHDDALCGRVEVEDDQGRGSGPQDFAFDDGVAYVLLKNPARDGIEGLTPAQQIEAIGRNIDRFIALCGPGLPVFRR